MSSLDAALQQFGRVVRAHTGIDVAGVGRRGAAGAVAAGLFGLVNGTLVSGIDNQKNRALGG